METINEFQRIASNGVYSVIDEYMSVVLNCTNVERKINYLINLGSLCYDYNQGTYASDIYKKALDLCLENETGMFPRFKTHALIAAKSIQFVNGSFCDNGCKTQYEEQIKNFYEQRFPMVNS
jgi:hypothetical protein